MLPLYNGQTSVTLYAGDIGGGTESFEANYFGSAGIYPNESTTYYHGDHLGSARLMTGSDGYPVWSSTFLPFGQEWNPQITVNHYKFTGKERDSESGLDNFGARYNSSQYGRFMTPDDPFTDQHTGDPQSWNLYSYVRNNPLRFTDPDGRYCVQGGDGNFHDDDQGGQSCAEASDPSQNNLPSATVFAQPDTSFWGDLTDFGLNLAFALDNLANDFFSPITSAIGVTPSYMQNTPTGSGFIAKTAAAAGAVAGMVVGPEGEAGEAVNISDKALQHVLDSHTTGGALVDASKSLFNGGEDVKALIQAAGSVEAKSQGSVKIFIVNAGRVIGIDRNTGMATRVYTVVTDSARNLITAHPGRP